MNLYKGVLLTFFLLVTGSYIPYPVLAQTPAISLDTIKIQTIPVPDTVFQQSNSDRILENLKQLSRKKTFWGRLTKSIFRFDPKATADYPNPVLLSNVGEKQNYKVIRRIDYKTLNSFGYSINDTTRKPHNFVEKAGNSVHIKTHRGRIRNTLLFKTGGILQPQALAESERLLRQKEYILDARLVVNEKTSTQDSVDIIVITKDVFSISGAVGFNTSKASGRVSLNDINFLGLGHQFRNVYNFGLDSISRSWTYSGSYTIENIYNSFASAQVIYRNEINYQQVGLNLSRDFYTANTKYAGAASYNYYLHPIYVKNDDGSRRRMNIEYNRQDYWLGKSFKLKSYNLGFENRARIITAGRIISTDYLNPPNADYQKNTLYVAGIGYSFRKYYRSQYLFGFGRTEDIPAGNLFALSAGYEDGILYNRRYLGGKVAFGKYNTNFGYLYLDAQYDTFIRGKRWEQGEFSSEILYFTKLLTVGTWQWRHFFWNRTTFGINRRFGENLLSINRQEGIRGFRTPERGTRRVVFNYENSLFTPISFLGFRVALVSFADIAWLSESDKGNPFKHQPYQGYGLGIRFRNEYMAFNTIQVLLGYYPLGTSPLRNFNSTRPYYDFNDFRFTQPLVPDFR
ncbi:MAG: hypothetical protein JWQ14_943 [Adhaeribacter sp.]|nr:hypothetical protein [Adhaeribacter sp.]